MFIFKNMEYYNHPKPLFPDALYYRDELGRDFYETRNALKDDTAVVTVNSDGHVMGFTTCIKEKPMSLCDKVSLYEVDPSDMPETLSEWTWSYSPERGFYKP